MINKVAEEQCCGGGTTSGRPATSRTVILWKMDELTKDRPVERNCKLQSDRRKRRWSVNEATAHRKRKTEKRQRSGRRVATESQWWMNRIEEQVKVIGKTSMIKQWQTSLLANCRFSWVLAQGHRRMRKCRRCGRRWKPRCGRREGWTRWQSRMIEAKEREREGGKEKPRLKECKQLTIKLLSKIVWSSRIEIWILKERQIKKWKAAEEDEETQVWTGATVSVIFFYFLLFLFIFFRCFCFTQSIRSRSKRRLWTTKMKWNRKWRAESKQALFHVQRENGRKEGRTRTGLRCSKKKDWRRYGKRTSGRNVCMQIKASKSNKTKTKKKAKERERERVKKKNRKH